MAGNRLLYVAIDQRVPGTLGGSVHVQSVAEGLAALGNDVHVATTPGGPWPAGPVTWHPMSPPFGTSALRWLRAGAVTDLARRIGARAIIERYYNFGGEGVIAAGRLGVPAILEVNAPVIDHPGSRKRTLDRALLVEPMRRWRDRLCRAAALFVTPRADILPAWVPREKILEIEWGADTDRFRPDAGGPPPFARDPRRILCVFAGAFRPWHGAVHLAEALARRHAAGDTRFGGVFIGDGPERAAVAQATHGVPGIVFTGALPHDDMPRALAACQIGVAPFDPARHPPLALSFFWSPLKMFEYMASGLPVVAPAQPRLRTLVEDSREGILYAPDNPLGLDKALLALTDEGVRAGLGANARERAVRDFSWRAHCVALDARLRTLVRP